MLYDVFICHASEDKDSFVRPLAEALKNSHLEVWYDEFSLIVGDSLRESIDKGLAKSRYGIVVISPSFFRKKWANRELNGLVAREMSGEDSVILPVWHNITLTEILEQSPPLADRKAVNSSEGIEIVCSELLKKLRPDDSPLLVARDELIHFGLNPPVVTDEWWLDVIEASNRNPCWGFAPQENSYWGRWTFPLPNFQSRGEYRGVRLAYTAMQLKWEREAESQKISQITHPEEVLDFISSQPGLSEICHKYPNILCAYAPQLTIKGFSGEFENDFDLLLSNSISKQRRLIDNQSNQGSGLTTTKLPPECSEEIALRHSHFGNYESSTIACQFVQGEIGGPEVKLHETFEYLIWFLSCKSDWMPKKVHEFLLDGLKEWNVWSRPSSDIVFGVADTFLHSLYKAKSIKTFKLGKKTKTSLLEWIKHSLIELDLTDDPSYILDRFIEKGFIESYFKEKKNYK